MYDYDQDKEMVEKYGVEGGRLPVAVFLDKKGEEIVRLTGEVSKKKLEEVLEENKGR